MSPPPMLSVMILLAALLHTPDAAALPPALLPATSVECSDVIDENDCDYGPPCRAFVDDVVCDLAFGVLPRRPTAADGADCENVLNARWCALFAGELPSVSSCGDALGGAFCAGLEATCRSAAESRACDLLVRFARPPVDAGLIPSRCASLVDADYCEGPISTCESLLHDARCPARAA